jgi:hypothetical protein
MAQKAGTVGSGRLHADALEKTPNDRIHGSIRRYPCRVVGKLSLARKRS